ncbi:DNA-directed RNA polymerase subunit omega [Desulfobacterota bacterium AH_259_B03_O07]|nr:DNA-directed RNA polymerase subunit omega [Desulfobacterota bacterium AH_259_B03_O07]
MARVTVEDCLEKLVNRFALPTASMKRAKQIVKGVLPLSQETGNKHVVLTLRKIAGEKIEVMYKPEQDQS